MKLAIHSDLHCDYNSDFPKNFLENKDFDVLVLAGDICEVRFLESVFLDIRKTIPDKVIVYVPGNHEYYHSSIDDADIQIKRLCRKYDIKNESFEYQGYNFLLGTMFSTYNAIPYLSGSEFHEQLENSIVDFRFIDNHNVLDMIRIGEDQKYILKKELETFNPENKNIVVSHFPPLLELKGGMYPITFVTSYFHNNHKDLFDNYDIDTWIFGHTHENLNKTIGNTKFISNQCGYGRENKYTYNSNFVFEV